MKALICSNCMDIFTVTKELRVCSCGDAKARLAARDENDTVAVYEGSMAIPIAINNRSLTRAIMRQGRRRQEFVSYVCPDPNRLFVEVADLTQDSWVGEVPVLVDDYKKNAG